MIALSANVAQITQVDTLTIIAMRSIDIEP